MRIAAVRQLELAMRALATERMSRSGLRASVTEFQRCRWLATRSAATYLKVRPFSGVREYASSPFKRRAIVDLLDPTGPCSKMTRFRGRSLTRPSARSSGA
jgi:hypothetical protein